MKINLISIFLSSLIRFVCSFYCVALAYRGLGENYYGVLTLFYSYLFLTSLFDFGITNFIFKSSAELKKEQRNSLGFNKYLVLRKAFRNYLMCIGLLALIVISFQSYIYDFSDIKKTDLNLAICLGIVLAIIFNLQNWLQIVIVAWGKFWIANIIYTTIALSRVLFYSLFVVTPEKFQMIVWAITILETFGLFLFAIIVIPRIVKIKIVSDKTKNEFESNEVKLQFQKQDANDGRTYFG